MKRGKDDEKTMGPMFPRLHVNDTEKGGPRAPPRNKMALYEQLSIPSQRFNGGAPPFNPNSAANSLPPSSSTPGPKKADSRHSEFYNQRVQQEHKTRQEDDDFRVPIFDQQSRTSQNRSKNHQIKETKVFSGRFANLQNSRQTQKENSQEFDRSASNQIQTPRQTSKFPLKEANESSSFSHRNVSNNLRDYKDDSQADKTLWGDNVVNTSVQVREVQQEASRSPNDPTNADAVSETSMVDSICGVDISPDDVVGIIGQKHFWKARRAIVNQQRVFAVQVFELHRLIKVQRLIAGSPQLLVEDNAYVAKPPKVSPIKKIPIEYVLKSTLNVPKHKTDVEKPNEETEFSAENAVGKVSLSSVQNGSQTTNCRPFTGPPPFDSNMGSWNYNMPPPGHQWLIPVMTPSEGLVYKPYPAPAGFMCGPPVSMPTIGHNFPNYGAHGPDGLHPFAPPASHGYFPAYGMPMMNPSTCEQTGPFDPQNQSSNNVPIEKNGSEVPNMVNLNGSKDNEVQASTASSQSDRTRGHKFPNYGYFPAYGMPMVNPSVSNSRCEQTGPFDPQNQSSNNVPKMVNFHASKDSEVQVSTASSQRDRTRGRNALPLFPTSPPTPASATVHVETAEPARVIRVVPHNARSATASVARIFRSIQEERKQYDSG